MSGRHLWSLRLCTIIGTAALAMLGGCTTLGGNVKGSFSCTAPDGICAPSSSIDDRALAMITGESGYPGAPATSNVGIRPKVKTSRIAAGGRRLLGSPAGPVRTQERVLRIVFQPYIDDQGRLHEASAVHAVVRSGEWQQQVLAVGATAEERGGRSLPESGDALADAVDRGDSAGSVVVDPSLPDPTVVAAARARATDPVQSIKSDVAVRLAARTSRSAPASQQAAGQDRAQHRGVGAAPQISTSAPVSPAAIAAAAEGAPKIAGGQAAKTRVKADPLVRTRAAEAEEAARAAAAVATPPQTNRDPKNVVRAGGFPASVPEEN